MTRVGRDLVQAMGLSGISKSSVSKLCKDIDERVMGFLQRPLTGEWPYLWLDATYLKVREGGRVVCGRHRGCCGHDRGPARDVGLHIGPSEAEVFWTDFLRDLVKRGLTGIRLVISDAHEGLKAMAGLMRASERGVNVSMLLEASDKHGGTVSIDAIAKMKAVLPAARIYSWAEKDGSFVGGKVHAKVAVADEASALFRVRILPVMRWKRIWKPAFSLEAARRHAIFIAI